MSKAIELFKVNEDSKEGWSMVRYIGDVALWVERVDGRFVPKVTSGDFCDLVGEGDSTATPEQACEAVCRIARSYFETCARATFPFVADEVVHVADDSDVEVAA